MPFLLATTAFTDVSLLSETEFRQLASDLAPKVNLFREVWAKDSQATFYGGTTRDFLYWVKGKLVDANTRAEADRIAHDLRELPLIQVREFIIGDSDVDVVAAHVPFVNSADFALRKLDTISPEIFRSESELGRNELWQGYAPAEKIRLSQSGFSQAAELGDGLRGIYQGKLSVHFADPEHFRQTKYAKEGLNHPVLLALRYLRLQAINYYRSHGSGYPDLEKLFASLDPQSKKEVERILRQAMASKELEPFLKKPKFHSWLNGTIQTFFMKFSLSCHRTLQLISPIEWTPPMNFWPLFSCDKS